MRMPRDLSTQELTELLHKTTPLPTLASGTTSWNLTKISGRSVRTADTMLKPLLLLTLRPGNKEASESFQVNKRSPAYMSYLI